MIRYKVVSKERERYYSSQKCRMDTDLEFMTVEYIPGEWVDEPIPRSGLFVFRELEDALTCRGNSDEVWEVEVGGDAYPELSWVLNLDSNRTTEESVREFWASPFTEDSQRYSYWPIPRGTERYPRVRLVRKVPC